MRRDLCFFSKVLVASAVMAFLFAGTAPASAKEPIKIGLIGALSSSYGASNQKVLEISVEDVNKAGGILGRPVELVVEDWKRQVPLAVAAYKKLVMTDKCSLVFTEGTEGTTACAEVASQLFPDYPHLQFCFWTANETVTDRVVEQYDKFKFLFRVYTNTADSFDPGMEQAAMFTDMIKTKKMALIMEDIGWTQPYWEGIPGRHPTLKEHFEKAGIQVVYHAKSSISEKMFLPMLEKCAASGADTIFWITGYTDTVALAKQWATSSAKDLDIVMMSGFVSYAAFYKMTGGAALGVVALNPEVEIAFTEKSGPFFEKLRARKAGLLASTYGACDGPFIFKNAVEKAGAMDMNKVIKALETGEFQHAFWKWKFDKRHEPVKGYPYYPNIWGQHQGPDKYRVVFQEDIRKLANPDQRFMPVKELRKKAGK